MSMLALGNTKLGRGIWTFSLPAGSSCPGKTKTCSSLCYAKKGFFVFGTVKNKLKQNLTESKQKDFVTRFNRELQEVRPRFVRLHASGDVYSPEYAEKIWHIIRANPKTVFFLYTRSWRDKSIAPVLMKMCLLDNCVMWLSTDVDSPKAPSWPGIAGRAYLARGVHDMPSSEDDLAFIDTKGSGPVKFLNGVLVCPYEQNVQRKAKITCSTCGFCLERQEGRRFSAASSTISSKPKRIELKMAG